MSNLMAVPAASMPAAMERALDLLEPQARPANARLTTGYIDLLGGEDPIGPRAGQRAAHSRIMPYVYSPIVHPIVMRLLAGLNAPGKRAEERMALEMLDLTAGDCVLDVACGPGNITRRYAQATGEQGLVVGVDASPPMLRFAARRMRLPNVAYMRMDGARLAFQADSFDAVACFGALHLFAEPMRALGEIVRVLAPGGRIAVAATCEQPSKSHGHDGQNRNLNGMKIFQRDEITGVLRDRGLVDVDQRVMHMVQLVSARKPA